MRKALSKAILNVMGWKLGPLEGVELPKCVICVAPHTSNWDFPLGKIVYTAIGCTASFLIKKEWFFFPFNLIFNALGGIPIDRSKRTSVTEQMVEQFNNRQVFQLAITPEATRKRAEEWKKGFYYIALAANVPILMAYFDYGKKEVGIKGVFHPTGDADADIRQIRSYYKGVKGKKPDNFVDIE
ncbi:lysophospholipid acyltransferase family protein [Parabacteroides sp. PF5-6]|uniref:lysophospholipid acyltransferase family protein n=1 Tax=Parabacteroides sp. PF5-6 TaxID=1742403 RepID=UPI002404FD30|nr:lysophospholipid acyltransferase family protein [Parabacteroides sp. PF5-6]MDF9830145.1 1-acyl-sn-glycerol-3-phosphate acyltransferase [Parabacteroides sp. PF5-6]